MVAALAALRSPRLLRVTQIDSAFHVEWSDTNGPALSLLEEVHIEWERWNEGIHRPSDWGRNYARCLVEKSGDPLPRQLLSAVTEIVFDGETVRL